MTAAGGAARRVTWQYRQGWRIARALVLSATTLAACAPVPLPNGEKRVVVRELATQVILPTLQDFSEAAASLASAVQRLSAEPSAAALSAAQKAWRQARAPWKEAEAFGFGPAAELRLAVMLDQSPVDRAKIEAEIAGSAVLDEAYVAELGANRKGFHALELLLFRPDDDAGVLLALTTETNAARRRDFLLALARNLASDAESLRRAWDATGDNYVTTLTEPASSNPSYTTIQGVVDTFVNEGVFLSEVVANTKLGKPMGAASGGVPEPELEESGPSDNSLSDMAGNLRGIRNVYVGSRTGRVDLGIHQLIVDQSPATDHAAQQAIARASQAIAAIPKPYRAALADQHPSVAAAYDAAKDLKRLLATEVVAVLGATLKFNDNDGD